MLEKMRDHSRNWLISFLFGIIIVVFAINFGPGFDQLNQTGCLSQKGIALKVDGESVSVREFQLLWRSRVSQIDRVMMSLGNKLPEKFRMQQRRRMIQREWPRLVDSIVDNILLSQAAERYGITISREEVEDSVSEDPNFQKDGIFDSRRFRMIVNNQFGLTIKQYLAQKRQEMQAARMKAIMKSGLRVTDKELLQDYKTNNTKVGVTYLSLPAKASISVKPTPKQIEAFLKRKGTEKKLTSLYNQRKRSYQEQVKASHILIKLKASQLKDAKIMAKKRKQIDDILAKAKKAPKDFAKLARKYSEGPTKTRGGNLGFFGKGMMDKKFEKAAFALKKKGDISPVVQSAFGFHIIQLTDRRPERTLKDKKLRNELAGELLKKEMQKNALRKLAESFLAQAKKGKSFEELKKLYKKAPKNAKKSKKPTSKPASAAASVATSKAVVQRPAYYKALAGKVQVMKPAPFPRYPKRVMGMALKDGREIVDVAFSLKKGQLADRVLEANGKFFLIKGRKMIKPDMKRFEKEKDELRDRAITRKFSVLLGTFLKKQKEDLQKRGRIFQNKSILTPQFDG